MSDSLRDQLLKAGLVTSRQAAQAERQQQQQRHQQARDRKLPSADEARQRAAEQARAAKATRDQALNRERQMRAEAKARDVALAQLVDAHKLPKPESDEYFNFVDRGKVRRIPVDRALRERILGGSLRIVRVVGRYELVPAEFAERVRERDASALIDLAASSQPVAAAAADDPYKDFVVPDDLHW